MEHVAIRLADDELWGQVMKNSLPDAGDVMMITKDHCTEGQRPGVCITFTVQLSDGTFARAQTVITGRIFAAMSAAFRGRYGSDGGSVQTPERTN